MLRPDQEIIAGFVPQGGRVLDLGCGDGQLLSELARTKEVLGYGIDVDSRGIEECIRKGVNIIEKNLDEGLNEFKDDSFDVVIIANSLQTVLRPDKLLHEGLRIAKNCIITIPNFSNWQCRFQLFFRGRMPVSSHLPHQWYETPNIHLCTFKEFRSLCKTQNAIIKKMIPLNFNGKPSLASRTIPDWLGANGIYHIGRKL